MSDMDRVRAVLDRLADQTEPPCRLDTYHAAYTQAIDKISCIAYPEARHE